MKKEEKATTKPKVIYELKHPYNKHKGELILQPSQKKFNLLHFTQKMGKEMYELGFKGIFKN